MNSLAWPKMFQGNSTAVLTGYDASKSCLHLLLHSESGELFGDPEFGVKLKKYTFEQNNYILKDILIDEIYTKIRTFCPQIYLERKNVVIEQEGNRVTARISCMNRADYSLSTYELVIFDEEDQ